MQTQTAWVQIPVPLLCHHESVTCSSEQLLFPPHITGVHRVCSSERCGGSDLRPQARTTALAQSKCSINPGCRHLCCYYQHYSATVVTRGPPPDRRAHGLKGPRAASADRDCVALQPLCFLRSAHFSQKGTEGKYFRPGRSHAVSITFFFLFVCFKKQFFKNIKPFLAHRLLRESHGWLVPAMLPYGEV